MSNPIPPNLKPIAPFIVKGTQMEKADPVIAYFCYVWAVQLLLAKELHTQGKEEMTYAVQLMDKLEQRKGVLADNEAITDDVVGQAYVEQFATKIFTNAANTQNAGKCTKTTAETFLAAAVFFELLKVFGNLDKETTGKILFAKYHANRILKALKAGEDPNLPIEEPELEEEAPPEFEPSHPPPPTVEEVNDESAHLSARMAGTSFANESLHPSRTMTPHVRPPQTNMDEPVSPPTSQHVTETSTSAYDSFPTPPPTELASSYFPPPPPTVVETSSLDLPSAPTDTEYYYNPTSPTGSSIPTAPPIGAQRAETPPVRQWDVTTPPTSYSQSPLPPPHPNHSCTSLPPPHSYAPPPSSMPVYAPPPQVAPYSPPPIQHQVPSFTAPPPPPPPPPQQQQQQHPAYIPEPHYQHPPAAHPPPPQQQIQQRQQQVRGDNLVNPDKDADLVTKAQKHARFAISALNFDDVGTAVKELRDALRTLGAEV